MKRLGCVVSLVVLASLMASCGGTATPTSLPPEPPPSMEPESKTTTADVVGILWKWELYEDTAGQNHLTVPDPDRYTLVFRADDEAQIQADCNQVGATYTLQGASLSIEPGPSTMALCGEESLDQQYLSNLSNVGTYVMHEGKLVLNLKADGGNMYFRHGGPADAAADTGAPLGGLDIDPTSVSIDTMGLPYAWQPNVVPATPYDSSQPPGPSGLPTHVQINFGNLDPEDKRPQDPVIHIIPVAAYSHLWEAAGDPSVTYILDHLSTLLAERPIPVPPFGMPVLPFEEIGAGVNDLAAQGRYLDYDKVSGVRFVGRFAQDANPVTNAGLRYIFQGFSNDGLYLITLFYPVTTNTLANPEDISSEEQQHVEADPSGYLEGKVQQLNALNDADWEPNLSALDGVLSSLTFKTTALSSMAPADLAGVTWQWAELTKSAPTAQLTVPDPENYTIFFQADGALKIKAHCNMMGGAYTLEGNALTIELGPSTLAFCGEGSLDQQYLDLLGQVGSYAREGDRLVLTLKDDAGQMVFDNGGSPQ